MRVLIVAAFLACAAAAPSGLLAAPYGHGLIGHAGLAVAHTAPYAAVAHATPLAVAHAPVAVAHAAPALPTISPGDIAGAAIDAHVEASDHVRAASDAAREYHDQASELQGRAINAAEDHSWQAVNAIQTAEAQLDGAAAGVAPTLAKQLVGHSAVVAAAPVAYAAHGYAGHAYAAPAVAYAHAPLAVAHAAPVAFARGLYA
ncbi:pupal cuticle protein PCP52-like [Trichoplusia ni]|uniref:Pupal cuticle protein PCP52-like n=1 Tax=Trichoplusia ni TaxID=7111 RepID=A0A7E5WN75_TRINI|nr:pupal cuticle protein PCP52-like [Trichoplusia ni]